METRSRRHFKPGAAFAMILACKSSARCALDRRRIDMVELPRKEVFETSAEAAAKINDIPSIPQEKPAPVSEGVAAGIRDQALEEAARIADQVAAGRDDMFQGLAALGALIAEGIRSLKQCERSTRAQ
jgi:hypothetical protein